MKVRSLALTNFRCFESWSVSFDAPVTLIEGDNGSGKTSLLEALHYACFMRSFRALTPQQMIRVGAPAFSVKMRGESAGEAWDLIVGASPEQRSAKLNGKSIVERNQILAHYRALTITEDDLDIVTGYPQARRHFLDTILFLMAPEYGALIKKYHVTLKQRTALLFASKLDRQAYELWTEQLRELAAMVQHQRRALTTHLELQMQQLTRTYCRGVFDEVSFEYNASEYTDAVGFREIETRRTLFGAHLDDMTILYGGIPARRYASRGQQKMIVMLLKLAALKVVNRPTLLLLDDVMADFDRTRLAHIVDAFLAHQAQMIVTCPWEGSAIADILGVKEQHRIKLPAQRFDNIESVAVDSKSFQL